MKPSILKHKSIIAIALALFMVVPMLFVGVPVKAGPPGTNATLSLVPSTNINLAYPNTLPSTFTVQVNIAAGQSVWGWNVGISWNPAVIKEIACAEGAYLSSVGKDLPPGATVDNTAGTLTDGDVLLVTSSANGAGNLFTITFQSVGYGSGSISITSITLKDPTSSHSNELYDTVLPYSIPLNNPTPPPHAPTAAYAIAASPATISTTFITIPNTASSTSITLDATSSSAGFDGFVNVPVNVYSWTIHSVGNKFADLTPTTSTVTLTGITADTIVVSLTVSATETSPPSGYTSTSAVDSVTYSIVQQLSTGIDVYTQNGGTGPNANSGPFGPQQNIVATASVISNGAPVAAKLVNFDVVDNNGNQFAFLTATTNEQGIASATFRLPTIDTGVEQGFGTNWKIIATVDVSEVQYVDVCKFTFSYLVNIVSVTPLPTSVVRGSATALTISVNINSMIPITGAQVTFTAVDSNNVPIACTNVVSTITVGNNNLGSGNLHVPNYAFVGAAKIYVNVLSPTALPCCPQNGEVITYNPTTGAFVSAVQNQPVQFTVSLS